MDTLTAAIEWYHQGISCIPCYPGSKALLKGTRVSHYYNQLVEFSRLVEWFGNGRYNIALVTMSGLVVLDFDSLPSYAIWRGKSQAETYTVETKRGYHCYFWIDEPVTACTCEYAEIKHSGKPVMIPPSIVDGYQYTIENDVPIMRVPSISDVIDIPQSKEKNIHITINGDNNTVHVGTSFFTLRRGIISRVKAALPILDYLSSQQPVQSSDGRFYMAHCPAHRDSNRSLSIDTQNGLCSCFKPGCKLHSRRGYDVVGVHSQLNGLSNGQAARDLALRLGF